MNPAKSSTGLDANAAAGLSVIGWWLTGLIFYLIEKDSAFVKFYAVQAIMLTLLAIGIGVLSFAAGMLPGVGLVRGPVLTLASVLPTILWIILLVNSFQGKVWEIPVIGKSARRIAGL